MSALKKFTVNTTTKTTMPNIHYINELARAKKAADTRKSNRESKMKAMGVVTPEVSIKKKPNLKK